MCTVLRSCIQETTPNLHTCWWGLNEVQKHSVPLGSLADGWKTGSYAREDQCMVQFDDDLFSFCDICFYLLLSSAYVCISFIFWHFCCASSCTADRVETPKRAYCGARAAKEAPLFFLLLSFLQIWRNKKKVGNLRFSFLTLIQGIRVKFCDCMSPRANYSVNISLSFTGSRQGCLNSRSGYREEDSQKIVTRTARKSFQPARWILFSPVQICNSRMMSRTCFFHLSVHVPKLLFALQRRGKGFFLLLVGYVENRYLPSLWHRWLVDFHTLPCQLLHLLCASNPSCWWRRKGWEPMYYRPEHIFWLKLQ